MAKRKSTDVPDGDGERPEPITRSRVRAEADLVFLEVEMGLMLTPDQADRLAARLAAAASAARRLATPEPPVDPTGRPRPKKR